MRVLLILALGLALTAAERITQSSGNDDTMVPGKVGADVVERTLEVMRTACVFEDDKLFMRRLAYAESFDGAKSGTFKDGYHGGIWQVDEAMFNKLKEPATRKKIAGYINNIKQTLQVDFDTAKWEDCRKARVSALAARLYIQSQIEGSKSFPRDIPEQAQFWKDQYRPAADKDVFVNAANKLNQGCSQIYGVDLTFVLDASGSVGSTNFKKMKDFVVDVVKSFDIGVNKTKVSVVKFSSSVNTEFYFNTYSTESAIVSRINRISYTGGGTNTHLALAHLYNTIYTSAKGARSLTQGVPRVAIVLTDGQSNKPSQTVINAMKAHDNDITMFAVGVGSASMTELEAIASMPTCLYLHMLKDFSEVESLKYAIQKGTCDAPIIVSPGDKGTDVDGRVPSGGDQNCKVKVSDGGATVKIYAKTGAIKFFISTNTYPSESYYDVMVTAVPGFPGVIYMEKPKTQDKEGIVYCNIKGDEKIDSDVEVGILPGDKDYCKAVECDNGGRCVDTNPGYRCFCLGGFEGDHCETRTDPCETNPCLKGACTKTDDSFICTCDEGWSGRLCNEGSDACSKNPCLHGNCTALGAGYECCCEPGYIGKNCDQPTDECSSDPCIHGACKDQINKYQCECKPGFIGINCEWELNECESNPCVNGDCYDKVNGYVCKCRPGWTGTYCEIDINECTSNPCMHGQCQDHVNGYTCFCQAGWTGTHCEINIDECESSPCVHGKCRDQVNGYQCVCDSGWSGKHCDKNIDECQSNPCVHGTCTDRVNGYICTCIPGYKGVNCEIEINECTSNPCQNGGTCNDRINSFQCICRPGFVGVLCETDVDECSKDKCVHGTCTDLINDYRCTCQVGWTGRNCDCLEDNCDSNPCVSGVCENAIGRYKCICNVGFTGPHCDSGTGGGKGTFDCIATNPCTRANRDRGRFYFPHTNPSKFVQCDAFGKCFVMPCPSGLQWNPRSLTCTGSHFDIPIEKP